MKFLKAEKFATENGMLQVNNISDSAMLIFSISSFVMLSQKAIDFLVLLVDLFTDAGEEK